MAGKLKIELLPFETARVPPDDMEADLPSKNGILDGLPLRSFLAFSFSSNLSGTPSHLALTFGTCSGIFAEDTINIPTVEDRGPCELCCFCNVSL